MVGWEGCPLYGLLCSAKLGMRLPFTRGASTAWEGGTPAFFVAVAWETLLNSASVGACLSTGAEFEMDGIGDGPRGSCGSPDPSPARPESSLRTLACDRVKTRTLQAAAIAGIARPHSWCT